MIFAIASLFVVLGGLTFAYGLGSSNFLYIIVGLITAMIGFYAWETRKK